MSKAIEIILATFLIVLVAVGAYHATGFPPDAEAQTPFIKAQWFFISDEGPTKTYMLEIRDYDNKGKKQKFLYLESKRSKKIVNVVKM